MEKMYKTSQRVSILTEEGKVLHRGAVVRGFNSQNATYHVTVRTDDELLAFHVHAKHLLGERETGFHQKASN